MLALLRFAIVAAALLLADPGVGLAQVATSDAIEDARTAANAGDPLWKRRFRECADCPEMVIIPGGSFLLGRPFDPDDEHPEWLERDRKEVTLNDFAIGRLEVTRGEFAAFASATGRPISDDCVSFSIGVDGNPPDQSPSVMALSWLRADGVASCCLDERC